MVSTRSTPAPRGMLVPQSSSSSRGKQSEQQQPDTAELLHVIQDLRQQFGEFRQQVNGLQDRLDASPGPPPPPPPPSPNDPPVGAQLPVIPAKDPLCHGASMVPITIT